MEELVSLSSVSSTHSIITLTLMYIHMLLRSLTVTRLMIMALLIMKSFVNCLKSLVSGSHSFSELTRIVLGPWRRMN